MIGHICKSFPASEEAHFHCLFLTRRFKNGRNRVWNEHFFSSRCFTFFELAVFEMKNTQGTWFWRLPVGAATKVFKPYGTHLNILRETNHLNCCSSRFPRLTSKAGCCTAGHVEFHKEKTRFVLKEKARKGNRVSCFQAFCLKPACDFRAPRCEHFWSIISHIRLFFFYLLVIYWKPNRIKMVKI